MELKVKQVLRLLENLECTMIYDVIRRISREHTLVVSERGRDDATLPTDLWKKPVSLQQLIFFSSFSNAFLIVVVHFFCCSTYICCFAGLDTNFSSY